MSLNYVNQVARWSARIELAAQEASIASMITSGLYQVDATGSKIIKTSMFGTPTVAPYTGTLTYEDLTDEGVDIPLDKKFSFAFKVDDVDQAQSGSVNLQDAPLVQGGRQLAIQADKTVFATVAEDEDHVKIEDEVAWSAFNVTQLFAQIGSMLDAKNVDADRVAVITPGMAAVLALSGLIKLADMRDEVAQSGYVGRWMGFDIYKSNSLAPVDTVEQDGRWSVFMSRRAVPYAGQINKIETVRLHDTFGDGVRGLYVFGTAVKHPNEVITVNSTSDIMAGVDINGDDSE